MGPLSEHSLETLADDGVLTLYRGLVEPGNRATLLLLSPSGWLTTAESRGRLQHIHALRDELDPSWATTPRELIEEGDCPLLLLDDPGNGRSKPLSQTVGPWELKSLLRVGAAIAAALGRLHASGLIHKDIRPNNILLDAAENRAWLTGFGIASLLPRERLAPAPPEVIAGTLPYMSPEQTGRMNRSIDSRSDLYALGITLHEMATGSLPYSATTPMEWIHCHIAREPASAAEAVPEQVAAIIRKLLAKNAEDRYQTATGLAADLARCLDGLETAGNIEPFVLGESDAPTRLLVPEKLYGREHDAGIIRAALERVVTTTNPELVLVSGYSGSGKSAVVSELYKVLVPAHGVFSIGKLDQHRGAVPYATIAQACQGMLREILGKSDADLTAWSAHLLQAVGSSAQLLVNLIPELGMVIGEQPPLPELSPQEAKSVFQRALRNLLSAFASKHRCLALFLDDLQWADGETLELIEALFKGEPIRKLLVIGAYRDNELEPGHPLLSLIARLRENPATVTEVVLGPLLVADLEQLVADALRRSRERVAPLARLIHEKTGGNPFFAIQFLTGLVDEALVAYDPVRQQWAWDTERVLAQRFTANVVEFMVGELERLPPPTQVAVRLLACVGNTCTRAMLSLIHGEGLDEALWAAVHAGLAFRTDASYGFLHDRVQEAAYALLPESERPAAHLRIGRLLSERLPAEQRDEAIFDLVNQYNRALALVVTPDERRVVAELNLAAGCRAWASAAHATAEPYFAAGRSVLTGDPWTTDHDLVFELERRRAECELMMIGTRSRAGDRLTMLWQRSNGLVEQACVTCLRLLLHASLHNLDGCIEASLEYFRELGIDWPAKPSDDRVQQELELFWDYVGERSIEGLIDLPVMSDRVSRGTMDVLAGLLGPAYGRSQGLLVLSVVHMTRLSIEQGNTDASVLAYSFLGLVLGPRMGRYQEGYRFGQLAVDLVARGGLDRFKARAWVVYAMSVVPWTRHLGESREILRRAVRASIEATDIAYAAYAEYLSVEARLGTADPLEALHLDAEAALTFCQKASYTVGVEFITTQLAFIRPLLGVTTPLERLAGEAELERACGDGDGDDVVQNAQNAVWVRLRKLQARVIAGVDAQAAAERTRELLWCIPERFERAEFHFYAGLAHAGAASADAVREHHGELARWAADCPENFGCRAAALAAELARIEGRELEAQHLYESALRQAREHQFAQVEALTGELAARFYGSRGFSSIANMYLQNARDAYRRWGALAKVRQLEDCFVQLRAEAQAAVTAERAALPFGDLDLATVVQVSQAVSAEILLGKLIQRTLTIAIENAGAERGFLILSRGGELQVEATAATTSGVVEVTLGESPIDPRRLPEGIVRFVARTRQSVILDDALAGVGPHADDPYLHAARVRSLLCLPLIKQSRLIGLLYLENNFMPEVFTPRRIALLELLASQAAISLENARLHTELQTTQDGLRQALRENRLIIDAIPAQIWSGFPDGSGEYFNEPWLDYTGLSQEQAAGWGWTTVLHPEDAAQTQGRWQSMRAAAVAADLELRIRRYDGVYRWFLVHVKPRFDESGRVLRWVGANLDIEELKQAQAELSLSESMLASGQRLTATGNFLWRPATGEIKFSQELNRIYGFSPGTQPTIERILATTHPDDRQLVTNNIKRSSTGWDHDPYEIRLLLPDGTVRPLQVTIHQTRDREGKLEVIGLMQDISERRSAEETLSKVRSDLAKMTRVASLGALTAAIAHEINQPLLGIMSNAGTCLRLLAAEPPKIEHALETVRRTLRDSQRAADVITRLRALFSNKNTARERVDLNEATREVLALSRSELQRNRVILRAEFGDDLPPLRGDRTQLQQVILNLLLNASEAMVTIEDRPRHLIVRTEQETGNRLRLTVQDVGTGIVAHDIERLFEPFHTTKTNGMGIGLSVSRSILESHGGRIWATPNGDGAGATFSFSLPTTTDDERPPLTETMG